MRTIVVVVLALAACGKGKDDKQEAPKKHEWKARGYRDTTAEERAAAEPKLAAAKLPLPGEWTQEPGDGKRRFTNGITEVELYVANAAESVAVLDEPPQTVEQLVARVKPKEDQRRSWPLYRNRFTTETTSGTLADGFWVRGSLQTNDNCGDIGCDPKAWVDGDNIGFVVYRTLGGEKFRCASKGNKIAKRELDAVFEACSKQLAL